MRSKKQREQQPVPAAPPAEAREPQLHPFERQLLDAQEEASDALWDGLAGTGAAGPLAEAATALFAAEADAARATVARAYLAGPHAGDQWTAATTLNWFRREVDALRGRALTYARNAAATMGNAGARLAHDVNRERLVRDQKRIVQQVTVLDGRELRQELGIPAWQRATGPDRRDALGHLVVPAIGHPDHERLMEQAIREREANEAADAAERAEQARRAQQLLASRYAVGARAAVDEDAERRRAASFLAGEPLAESEAGPPAAEPSAPEAERLAVVEPEPTIRPRDPRSPAERAAAMEALIRQAVADDEEA